MIASPKQTKEFMTMLGISATVATFLLLIVVVGLIYKNYLDTKLTRLRILQLTRDLKVQDKGIDKVVDTVTDKIGAY